MATTLKTTDLRLPSQRVNLTAPDADDILMIEDISESAGNKLKYITKAQVKSDFGIDDNESAITAVKGAGWTDENLVDHETRLSGLDTLTYEGVTYKLSKSVVDGHIVEHYEEVV